MKMIITFLIVTLLSSSCGVTNNWKGSSLPRDSHATFGQFSGTQKFKMKLDRATGLTAMNYGIKLEEGEVRMIVKYNNKEVLDTSTSTEVNDSIRIENTADPDIEVVLIGTKARGSYHIDLQNL